MRILIVKTSSLGDVINTLPAITEACQYYPNLKFTWVIEPAFAEIPTWHCACAQVIPIALRQWRKHPWQAWQKGNWQTFYRNLRQTKYDFIIDAQGLIKSAWITRLAQGIRCGYDWPSAWEAPASLAYQRRFAVDPAQHAIKRIQQLFAQVFNYAINPNALNYGLTNLSFNASSHVKPYVMLLHGTARAEKQWPETQWQQIIAKLKATPYQILLPWGNALEYARAQRLAAKQTQVSLLPRYSLTQMASLLVHSQANIAVDTGLGHLAAALGSPTLSLYGPTSPALNGTRGAQQHHLSSDNLASLSAHVVWKLFQPLLAF